MRRSSVLGLTVLLIASILVLGLYIIFFGTPEDTNAPTIKFSSDSLILSVYDEPTMLLQGVKAYDEHDGDVTDRILVEGVSTIRDDHSVTITYAVFDEAGNVSKAKRVGKYIDYVPPRFDLNAPLFFRASSTINVFKNLSATDLLDGDISHRIKASLVEGSGSLTEPGLHQIELRVTNSMGQTVKLFVPVEIYEAGTYNATLELDEYLVYLKAGSQFDPEEYMGTLTYYGNSYPFSQLSPDDYNVEIESTVNTALEGTYYVTYTATYRSYTARTWLIVCVED